MPALKPELEAAIPTTLIDALRDRSCLALVGAGLSRGLDFPDWGGLLYELAAAILSERNEKSESDRLLEKAPSSPEWVAEVLKHQSKDAYVTTLRNRFDRYAPRRFSLPHALLAALPFRGFLTTNYDHVLEDYVSVLDQLPPDVVTPFQQANPSGILRRDGRFVVKLHGCAQRDAANLVLSSADYFQIMRDEAYERLMASLFQRFTIVTLGFGLADRDLMRFIEERRHLYGNIVPTVFAIVTDTTITQAEVNTYRSAYNVVIVPFSPERNYAQLAELLLSIYCILHSADSQTIGAEIEQLAARAYRNVPFVTATDTDELSRDLEEVRDLLSAFHDPIPMMRLASWLGRERHRIGTAQLRMLTTSTPDGRLEIRQRRPPNAAARAKVGNWIRTEVASTSEDMTPHDKEVIGSVLKTISALLETEDGVRALLNPTGDADVFKRLSQYFKHAGYWTDWQRKISLIETIATPLAERALLKAVLLDKIWLLYWQARYSEARKVFDASVAILSGERKARTYDYRLQFRLASTSEELESLLQTIATTTAQSGDDFSLLGQINFALYRRTREPKYHNATLVNFNKALHDASKLAELAVQNYYLACVYAEFRELPAARAALSEVHRIDTAMLRRVPGMAWQKVAAYRIALAEKPEAAGSLRSSAVEGLKGLGILSPESFVDEDFV